MGNSVVKNRGRRGTPAAWSVDVHVGERVRTRRILLGMSQESLGEAIGLTFQQIQKYERGANRISAGMLYQMGEALDVPVSYFFGGYRDTSPTTPAEAQPVSVPASGPTISRREARMLRLWRAAPPSVANEVLALLASMSPTTPDVSDEDDAAEPATPALPIVAERLKPVGIGARGAPTSLVAPAPVVEPVAPPAPAERKASAGAEADAEPPRKRRRHGAVWDPTDIYRGA